MSSIEPNASATEASSSPSIQIGDLTFTPMRVVLSREGQLVTSVRRDAFDSVNIGDGSASGHSGHELLWGGGFILVALFSGAATLASSHVRTGSILGSLASFLLGVLLVRSGSGTTTVVRLRGSNGEVVLSVGRKLKDADIFALRRRLCDELGYPAPASPQSRGF